MFRFFLTLFAAAWLFYPANALGAEPDSEVDVVQVDNGGGSIPAATVGVIIAAVLGGLGFTAGRKSAVKIEPSPLSVDVTQQMLPRAEFDEYRKEQSKEISNVHKRIDNLVPSVSEIKGKLDHISTTQTTILELLLKKKNG